MSDRQTQTLKICCYSCRTAYERLPNMKIQFLKMSEVKKTSTKLVIHKFSFYISNIVLGSSMQHAHSRCNSVCVCLGCHTVASSGLCCTELHALVLTHLDVLPGCEKRQRDRAPHLHPSTPIKAYSLLSLSQQGGGFPERMKEQIIVSRS